MEPSLFSWPNSDGYMVYVKTRHQESKIGGQSVKILVGGSRPGQASTKTLWSTRSTQTLWSYPGIRAFGQD